MAAEPAPAHVVISVATFRRPDGLRRLIASLNRLELPAPPPRLELVVVDNDPSGPSAADAAALRAHSRFPLTCLAEPRRGVVSARNRGLAALPAGADIVAFLDDDETVSPGWLSAMLAALGESGATAAQGPVVPVYEAAPPVWVPALGFFALGPFAPGQRLATASTSNSCVRVAFLRAKDLSFDPAFNESGGEDDAFFRQLRAAGGSIVAAPGAIVQDRVPAHRMTPRWHLLRARRVGNTLGRIALLQRQGRALRLAKGLAQVALGMVLALTSGAIGPTARMRGLARAARGLGTVQAFLGIEVREYSAAAVRRDRPAGAATGALPHVAASRAARGR